MCSNCIKEQLEQLNVNSSISWTVSIFMGSLGISMKFLLIVFVLSLHKDEVLGVCYLALYSKCLKKISVYQRTSDSKNYS